MTRRVAALRAALDVAPEDFELRGLLADALEVSERWKEAIDERRTILRDHPADPKARLALARAFVSDGQFGAADVILEQLERDDAMPPEGWRLRGRLLAADISSGHAVGADGATAVREP